jgi:NADH-quinone oxidoreductase subunit L
VIPALIGLPFLAALAGMLFGRRLPGWFAAAVTAVSAVLAITVLATVSSVSERSIQLTPTGGIPIVLGFRVDTLSATVGVMVTVVALAVQVFSIGYMQGKPRRPSFTAMISLFTAAMLLVVFSADLLVLYAGWEVMGLCSYFLIGYRWEKPADTAAAVKAFLMTRVGDVAFLIGIFVLGFAAGSFRVEAVLHAAPGSATTIGTLLLVFGIVAKSAQFPMHSWLPDAMAGPAPVSALIHAATMVAAGAYVVALLHPVFVLAPVSMAVLAVLASVSMLGAALAALAVEDLKRALAYSTISQLGFILASLTQATTMPGIAHLLTHAAFKALLFLGAGAVLVAAGSTARGGRGMRVTFVTMTIGFAALAGIPPTSGFFSKDAVVAGMSGIFVLGCALPTIAITAAYATRMWLRTFFGTPSDAKDGPLVMTGSLVALAVPALLLGVAVVWIPALRPDLTSTLVSLPLIAVGVVVGYLSRGTKQAIHAEGVYERTIAPVVVKLANRVADADDVLGRAVTDTGRGAAGLGGVLRRVQNGNAQAYVTGVLVGVLILAFGVVALR